MVSYRLLIVLFYYICINISHDLFIDFTCLALVSRSVRTSQGRRLLGPQVLNRTTLHVGPLQG